MDRLADLDEIVKDRVVRAASHGAFLIYSAVVRRAASRWQRKELRQPQQPQPLGAAAELAELALHVLVRQVEKGSARVGFEEVAADHATVRQEPPRPRRQSRRAAAATHRGVVVTVQLPPLSQSRMTGGTNMVEIYSDVFNQEDPLCISVRVFRSVSSLPQESHARVICILRTLLESQTAPRSVGHWRQQLTTNASHLSFFFGACRVPGQGPARRQLG